MEEKIMDVELTMSLIGSRWRPAIMYILVLQGTQRFSELRRQIPEVSQRMLTLQLRSLESAKLISRTFHESIPPRVEYAATDLGRSLQPIYEQVCEWTTAHRAELSEHHATRGRAQLAFPRDET